MAYLPRGPRPNHAIQRRQRSPTRNAMCLSTSDITMKRLIAFRFIISVPTHAYRCADLIVHNVTSQWKREDSDPNIDLSPASCFDIRQPHS